jgi:putative membrane protein
MFAWETAGKKAFKGSMPDELFKPTKVLAANQGLYNGFLAAGLIWSLFIQDADWQRYVAIFFLSCVLVAGIYGGLTAGKKILLVQALPALLALLSLWF